VRGSSHDLAVATPVMTMGYPMDLPLTPEPAIFAGLDRKFVSAHFTTTLFARRMGPYSVAKAGHVL